MAQEDSQGKLKNNHHILDQRAVATLKQMLKENEVLGKDSFENILP